MKVEGAYIQPDGGHQQEFLEAGRTAWVALHARKAQRSTPGHLVSNIRVPQFTVFASMSWTA